MSSHSAAQAIDSRAHVDETPTRVPQPLERPTLTIVIPALNEEESIGTTMRRCLDARQHIRHAGHVEQVEIIVVSDGSTDRTAEIAETIAAQEAMVRVIVFPKNRGYGAAIKEGFRTGSGELVAFLDADGTCDPNCFAEMCRVLQKQDAAIVLGSRMGAGNQMPKVRRLGNHMYALLLGFLSGKAVSDTASGMRVIRRASLGDLYPLPDGLHFTPAMSARAVMGELRIVEVPMPYAERVGESKLKVFRDGIRFLLAIGDAMLLYRAGRFFGLAAVLCLMGAWFWGSYPLEFYVQHRRLEEWMIYRLLLSTFLFTASFAIAFAGVLAAQILSLVYRRHHERFWVRLSASMLSTRNLVAGAVLASLAAVALVWPGLVEYAVTGHVSLHWSRPMAGVFLLQLSLLAGIHAVLQKVVGLWKSEIEHGERLGSASDAI